MTNKLVYGGNIVVSAGYNEAVNGYPLNSVFGYRYVGKVQNQDQLDYYVDKYVGSNSIALPANLRLGDHMLISIPCSKVWASVPFIVKSTLGKCLSKLFG